MNEMTTGVKIDPRFAFDVNDSAPESLTVGLVYVTSSTHNLYVIVSPLTLPEMEGMKKAGGPPGMGGAARASTLPRMVSPTKAPSVPEERSVPS